MEFERLLTDAVNPVLGACALGQAYRLRPKHGRFLVALIAGIGLVYLLHFSDRLFGWWASAGLDFSTHTAFAVSLAASLATARPRWLWIVVPLLAGYGWLMVDLRYHTWADFLTSAPLPAVTTWGCQYLFGARHAVHR